MLKYQIVVAGVGIAFDGESASEAATVATRAIGRNRRSNRTRKNMNLFESESKIGPFTHPSFLFKRNSVRSETL
jgi:hypothetical protein